MGRLPELTHRRRLRAAAFSCDTQAVTDADDAVPLSTDRTPAAPGSQERSTVDPTDIARIIDRAVALARLRGCPDPTVDLRRRLALMLFAELRADRQLERHR